jgi:hypothetical protein
MVISFLLVVALAATTAACGDDDDDDAASDTLSRSELIAAGDAICAETSRKNQPIEEATFTGDAPPPLARWAEFWPKLADNEQAAADQMSQLHPSAGDLADFTAAVDAYATLIPLFRAAGEKATAGDQAGHDAAMAEIERASQPVAAGFGKLGFKECGSDEE